jgi:hypothetical protein
MSLIAALSAGQQVQTTGGAQTAPSTTSAPVAQAAPAPATTTETATTDRDRVVCISIPVTGSRFPIRRCRTQAQADAERIDAQDDLRRSQSNRLPSS